MWSNPGVRYGLIGGTVVVACFLLIYFIDPGLFFNPVLQWGSLAIYVGFMWVSAKKDIEMKGSGRDFRELLRTPFMVFLLINLCYWIFYYALHLFDPGLVQAEMSLELQSLKTQVAAGTGDPQQANALRERIAELEKVMQTTPEQPLGPVVTRMFIGALGGFALAAGVAAFFRSRK